MEAETYYRLSDHMKGFLDKVSEEYEIVSIEFDGSYNLKLTLKSKGSGWDEAINLINNHDGKDKS